MSSPAPTISTTASASSATTSAERNRRCSLPAGRTPSRLGLQREVGSPAAGLDRGHEPERHPDQHREPESDQRAPCASIPTAPTRGMLAGASASSSWSPPSASTIPRAHRPR